MEVFETPSWDGDHGEQKLTNELFRSLNVPLVKVSKKRKRNKYPKRSVIDEQTKISDTPKRGKGKSAKLKKNGICDSGQLPHLQAHSLISKEKKCKEKPKQTKDRVESNDVHMEKIKCSSQIRNVRNDDIQANSFSNSTVNPTLSSIPLIKHNKKKKKQKYIALEDEIKNVKYDHNLKTLKDKLDLNLKVELHVKESNKAISTPAGYHKQPNHFLEKHNHGSSSHSIKNLQMKASINLNCDQKHVNLHPHLKKKSEDDVKKKIKTTYVTNLPQNIIHNKTEQSTPPKSLHNQSNSPVFQKKIISFDGNTKILKKEKTGDACENVSISLGSSLGIPSAAMIKKRKHSENYETGKKRVKKLKYGDTKVDFDSLSNETPPNSDVVSQKAKELHCVGRTINCGSATIPKKKPTLREKMMEKLRGSRFRFLNEQMYSSRSEETRKFFQSDQESFGAYHEGYKQQLLQWPVKPVDIIIKYLKKKPVNYIIADFGCGDAHIAQSLPNKVHSFDHVALNDHVTVCDMAHTPLSNGSVDVAVFCLSLMGSNLSDYVYEANRVLKIGGILKIAEVESRFDDVEKFIKVICKFGFLCIRRDLSKDVFYLFDFKKEKNLKDGKSLPTIELRACSYKKR